MLLVWETKVQWTVPTTVRRLRLVPLPQRDLPSRSSLLWLLIAPRFLPGLTAYPCVSLAGDGARIIRGADAMGGVLVVLLSSGWTWR